jgi:hypothetical protein
MKMGFPGFWVGAVRTSKYSDTRRENRETRTGAGLRVKESSSVTFGSNSRIADQAVHLTRGRSFLVTKALRAFDLDHDTVLNRQAHLAELKPGECLTNLGERPSGPAIFLKMQVLASFLDLLGKHVRFSYMV